MSQAEKLRAARSPDLFAVDPLASFLPGRSDSDPATLLDLLLPLRRLAEGGVAVLVLHHPRKKPAEEGSTARGSGALLGFVAIILEVHRYGGLSPDDCRRRVVGLSRHPATPRSLIYEWVPGTPRVPPSATQLYEWLGRGVAEGLAERTGDGTKKYPYRFRLPTPDPLGDLPELPPLPPLG